MNEIKTETRAENHTHQIEIWFCPGCKVVHLGLGDTKLSFERFGDFDILSAAREIEVEAAEQVQGN